MESPARRNPLARAWPLLLVAGLLALAWASGAARLLSFETLAEHRAALTAWVAARPGVSAAAYVGLYVAVVALSLPGGAVMTLAGGFLFGAWIGTALAVLGATLGACALFLAARTALAPLVAGRAAGLVERLRPGLERDGFFYLLTLRLIPVVPFWLANLAPALLGMPFGAYAAATALGIIPATAVYSGIGAGLGEILAAGGRPDLAVILSPPILLPLLGLAALSLFGAWWRGRTRND
ncbi:TVP38/TMEM64 family protein [Roseomonas alkaliterrae]|uniref:TVP38/TMEM64 family membrane protein n=1 Tax=Neoroseomonas alkaliterrae TaxID=1452450 RepID=A0A840XQD5_9PROT|nr:TVP38/TMEM64 family protein [Neoroseomonas alkaliterrae]MBB5688909.1 putative membrane protein YdjX (TVP38/TMEM64 family) [Neoroseomonas alkaliterrae]MBR0677279.1 TVP38/TMEM64 family protein [Neoroseomonas alkaliterrae]